MTIPYNASSQSMSKYVIDCLYYLSYDEKKIKLYKIMFILSVFLEDIIYTPYDKGL